MPKTTNLELIRTGFERAEKEKKEKAIAQAIAFIKFSLLSVYSNINY